MQIASDLRHCPNVRFTPAFDRDFAVNRLKISQFFKSSSIHMIPGYSIHRNAPDSTRQGICRCVPFRHSPLPQVRFKCQQSETENRRTPTPGASRKPAAYLLPSSLAPCFSKMDKETVRSLNLMRFNHLQAKFKRRTLPVSQYENPKSQKTSRLQETSLPANSARLC
jgi:hypothetical protein